MNPLQKDKKNGKDVSEKKLSKFKKKDFWEWIHKWID